MSSRSTWHAAAASVGRASGTLSRVLRLGAGETIAGRVAQRVSPSLPGALAKELSDGVVVVSGTNGKTTTASMIVAIAEAHGILCVTNRSGSNMPSGIVGALLHSRDARLGVFEVDEMALPVLVPVVRPRVAVLTNVFRDQLDRFGEPEKVASLFEQAASLLSPESRIVANGDDPNLGGRSWPRPVSLYGVRVQDHEDPHGAGEPEICPVCGAPLIAEQRTLANLGVFGCSRCSWRSPEPNVTARVIERDGLESIRLDVGGTKFSLGAGGVYNAYNAAAAIAAADALGLDRETAIKALSQFRPRFGRLERLSFDGCHVLLALAKNPAGANAVLAELRTRPLGAVVIAVNDLAADGRDVSWIWDVEFELLVDVGVPVVASGRRAEEVALRLHYAGIRVAACERSPETAARTASHLAGGAEISMLATYTAMLGLRRSVLGRTKHVSDLERA